MARTYEMSKRARQIEETRKRITEAAVELHGTVGPAKTTVSAVAELAGVERLTVYRHFPDEFALFRACTTNWLEQHPFPDPARWSSVADPGERLRVALGELYAWYSETRQMMANFFRDGPSVPALHERLAEWQTYMEVSREVLGRGWGLRGHKRTHLLAAIGHALDFRSWSSLREQGAEDEAAVELMVGFVRTAAAGEVESRPVTRGEAA